MDQKQSSAAARGRRGRGEAFYRKVLSEQEASGQSLRAFAAKRGLSPWTLYGWRAKLGQARPRVGARRARPKSATDFVAVDVVVGSEVTGDIEVVLADGCRVRLPRDLELERLTALLRSLRSC